MSWRLLPLAGEEGTRASGEMRDIRAMLEIETSTMEPSARHAPYSPNSIGFNSSKRSPGPGLSRGDSPPK